MENDEELNEMNNQILAFMKKVEQKFSGHAECKTICRSCESISKELNIMRINEAKTLKTK